MNWSDADVAKAQKHFWAFVYIVWKSIGLPDPTPIQVDIAQYLQKPPSDRVVIQGFRGVAKSFLTCAYAVWRLWQNRDLKVLIISASKDRADDNARFIKSIIRTLPFLADMKADKTQLDTQNIFNVGGAQADISPSVKSVGITGQITGTRADLLISDDVEVPKNSGTQLQRDKLSEAVKEYDAILKPGGQIIYLGTPQNEASLYNTLQKRGYSTRIWTVLYPESEAELLSYGGSLAPFITERYYSDPEKYAGQPTDPKRFDEIEIDRFKHGSHAVQVLFVPLRAHGDDFLDIFVFCAQSVGGCAAIAEPEQAVFFHAFMPQDLARIFGGLGVGQRGGAERGASVSARIYGNHAVVLLQTRQQRGKVGNRTETAVQQHDNWGGFRAACLIVQHRALMFDEFRLHGSFLVWLVERMAAAVVLPIAGGNRQYCCGQFE